jgi:hypothetical protein
LDDFDRFARKVVEKGCPYVTPLGRMATDDWSQANPQMRWIEQGLDFIGRFERLQDDWNYLCLLLDLPSVVLPVERKSNRRYSHYSHYYSDELVEMVGNFYHEDVTAFGYFFEEKRFDDLV